MTPCPFALDWHRTPISNVPIFQFSNFFQYFLSRAVLDHIVPVTALISSSHLLYCLPRFHFLCRGYQFITVLLNFSEPLGVWPVHFHFIVRIVFSDVFLSYSIRFPYASHTPFHRPLADFEFLVVCFSPKPKALLVGNRR